jgi:radical SAM superfamily enzyme YgiQ (UPF0313 family)
MAHTVLLYPRTGSRRPQDQILPLSLVYIAAPLLHNGHKVTIIDQRLFEDWRERLDKALAEPGTCAAGISTMTGPQITHALEMAAHIRSRAPEMPLVWGGVHPTLLPEQTLASPFVDIVAMGEGEACFPALIDALAANDSWQNLPGLCYMRGGKAVRNPLPPRPDLETLPPPPYELVDLDAYRIRPLRAAGPSLPVVTSRGCAYHCAYCYGGEFHDSQWRGLPAEAAVELMARVVRDFRGEGLFLLDDNFFQDIERVHQIFKTLVEKGPNVPVYNANCRANLLYFMEDEDLALMRKAGVEQIFIGVESGSPEVLRDMRKGISPGQVIAVNLRLREHGISPVFSFMAGLPGETPEDIGMTLDLMMRLKRDNPGAKMYKMGLFVPFPGTDYCRRCSESGSRLPERLEDWGRYDYDHANIDYLSPEFRAYLERVSELSGFIDVDGKISGLAAPLVRAYAAVARWRCSNRRFGWMPEMRLIRRARARQRG